MRDANWDFVKDMPYKREKNYTPLRWRALLGRLVSQKTSMQLRSYPHQLSPGKVKEALADTGCDVVRAASLLGVSLQKLNLYINKRPMLESMIVRGRMDMLSLAESNLRMLLLEGDYKATEFVLKTLGRQWYNEKVETGRNLNDLTDEQLVKLLESKLDAH